MKIISACSFKGGTAKTSITLNTGACLAMHHGKRVLVIDFDAQANLTAGLGLDPDSYDSLASVLQGEKLIEDVIVPIASSGLDLIPADTWLERVEVTGVLASDRYAHERLKKILGTLDYDFILIDTPPSLCWLTESALIAASHALICAAPEFYSVKGLQRLSYFLHYIAKRHPLDVIGVVLSFWNARGKSNDDFVHIINETFPDKLLQTRIRKDVLISEATIYGKSVFDLRPKSRAARDLADVTEEILSRCVAKEPVCLN